MFRYRRISLAASRGAAEFWVVAARTATASLSASAQIQCHRAYVGVVCQEAPSRSQTRRNLMTYRPPWSASAAAAGTGRHPKWLPPASFQTAGCRTANGCRQHEWLPPASSSYQEEPRAVARKRTKVNRKKKREVEDKKLYSHHGIRTRYAKTPLKSSASLPFTTLACG